MHWNHRVLRHIGNEGIKGTPEYYYQVHEVFYNDDHTINGWAEKGVCPMGETLEDLQEELDRCKRALNTPVLEEIPGSNPPKLRRVSEKPAEEND